MSQNVTPSSAIAEIRFHLQEVGSELWAVNDVLTILGESISTCRTRASVVFRNLIPLVLDELERLKNENEKLRADRDAWKTKYDCLWQQATKLVQERDAEMNQISQLSDEVERLRGKASDFSKYRSSPSLIEENQRLQAKVLEQKKENEALCAETERLRKEVFRLSSYEIDYSWVKGMVDNKVSHHTLVEINAQLESMSSELEKLRAFKSWVHKYLDDKGIPVNPGGPHTKEGCRIGDRMDIVFAIINDRNTEINNLFNRMDRFRRENIVFREAMYRVQHWDEGDEAGSVSAIKVIAENAFRKANLPEKTGKGE